MQICSIVLPAHTVMINYNIALARIIILSNEARLQKLGARAIASVIKITLDTLDHSCSVALITIAVRCKYLMLYSLAVPQAVDILHVCTYDQE